MGPQGLAYWRRVFYSECLEKNKHLKRKHLKRKQREITQKERRSKDGWCWTRSARVYSWRESQTESRRAHHSTIKLRHWLEYVYGTEYFDALIEEILRVYADPRLNNEYFCTESNLELLWMIFIRGSSKSLLGLRTSVKVPYLARVSSKSIRKSMSQRLDALRYVKRL